MHSSSQERHEAVGRRGGEPKFLRLPGCQSQPCLRDAPAVDKPEAAQVLSHFLPNCLCSILAKGTGTRRTYDQPCLLFRADAVENCRSVFLYHECGPKGRQWQMLRTGQSFLPIRLRNCDALPVFATRIPKGMSENGHRTYYLPK